MFQKIMFSINIAFGYTQLNVKQFHFKQFCLAYKNNFI